MKLKLFTVSIMVGAGLVACGTSKHDSSSTAPNANALTAGQNVPRYFYVVTSKDGSQQTIQASAPLSQDDLVAQAGSNQIATIVSDQSTLNSSTQSFWSGMNNTNCHQHFDYNGSGHNGNSHDSTGHNYHDSSWCQPVYAYANANVWYAPVPAPMPLAPAVMVTTTTVQPIAQPYAYNFGATSPYSYVNVYQPNTLNTYGWGTPAAGIDMGYGQQGYGQAAGSLYGANNGYALNSGTDCARQSAFMGYGAATTNSNCVRSSTDYVW